MSLHPAERAFLEALGLKPVTSSAQLRKAFFQVCTGLAFRDWLRPGRPRHGRHPEAVLNEAIGNTIRPLLDHARAYVTSDGRYVILSHPYGTTPMEERVAWVKKLTGLGIIVRFLGRTSWHHPDCELIMFERDLARGIVMGSYKAA